MRTLLPLLLIGCGGSKSPVELAAPQHIVMTVEIVPPAAPATPATPAAPAAPATPAHELKAAELFGKGIRSVELRATTVLYKEPDATAARAGVIRKGTRAGVRSAAAGGHGCARGRWIELAPRGWACEAALAPSREPRTEAAAPSLTDDAAQPLPLEGPYGIVRGKDVTAYTTAKDASAGENGRALVGSYTVRSTGTLKAEGKRFWHTSQGDLIDAASISVLDPSKFRGVALAPDAPLPAWVRARRDATKPVVTREAPAETAAALGALAPRTVVTILEESADKSFVRIDARAWVLRADLRAASVAAPPPGIADDEKWLDVDLDEQILVAYEGKRPVYATLVSTGRPGHTTPVMMARVSAKLSSTHMINTQRDKYSVADVPWTMVYDGGYAVHTAYWHDGFGGSRSHGCVNLSPSDARLLYQWSSPEVPPGWIAVYGDEDHPGSLVRVRSRSAPEPALRGYARAMHDRDTRIAAR